MSKFLTEIDAYLKDDNIWILNSPLIYQSDILGCEVEVPTGFNTDLASVPRLPIIFSFWGGRTHRESVIHDYLFRKDSQPVVSFFEANKVFNEAGRCRGKSRWIRWPMFIGTIIGGYGSYHKKKVNV